MRAPSGRRGGGGRKSPGPSGGNGHAPAQKSPENDFSGVAHGRGPRRGRARARGSSGVPQGVAARAGLALPPQCRCGAFQCPKNGQKTPGVRTVAEKRITRVLGDSVGCGGTPSPGPMAPPQAMRRYPPGTEKGRGPSQPRPLALAPLCLAPPAEPPRGPRRHRLVVPDVCRVLARTGYRTPREKARRDPPRFEVGRVSRQRGPVGLENLG